MRQTECLFLPYLWETWTYFCSFYKLWHIYRVIHVFVQHFLCLCALKKKSECSAHRWAFQDAERGSSASAPREGIEVLAGMWATQDPFLGLSAYGLDLTSWGFRESCLLHRTWSGSWVNGRLASISMPEMFITLRTLPAELALTCRSGCLFPGKLLNLLLKGF